MANPYLSEEDVQYALNYWKERLMITNWTVTVIIGAGVNAVSPGKIDAVHKETVISISTDDETVYDRLIVYNFEYILIQQLLHCKFALIEEEISESSENYDVFHRCLDEITQALIGEHRSKSSFVPSIKVVSKAIIEEKIE